MAGIIGTGATLSKGGNDIGKLLSLNIDGISVSDIDVTNMQSLDSKEYVASELKDLGTISCEVLAESALSDADVGGTAEAISIAGTSFTYSGVHGYIQSLGAAIPLEDKITQSITIKLTKALA